MKATVRQMSERLLAMLREQHDAGAAPLRVLPDVPRGTLTITRADGSELSVSERAHVRAILAAHAAEPI